MRGELSDRECKVICVALIVYRNMLYGLDMPVLDALIKKFKEYIKNEQKNEEK